MSGQKNVSKMVPYRTVRSELGLSNVASHPIHVYGRSRAPRLSTRLGCLAGARLELLEVLVTPTFVIRLPESWEGEDAATSIWGTAILFTVVVELGP